jgi:hypothetical protein
MLPAAMSRKREKARAKAKADRSDRKAPVVTDVEAIEIDLDFDDVPSVNAMRRSPRVPVDAKVEISGLFGNEPREDRLADASVQGVFVETAHPYDVGDPVVLHLPLEDGKKLRVSGRVRWVTPFGGLRDARPGMGIELVGVVGETKQALNAMLRRRAR